jgi:hypothetical protein
MNQNSIILNIFGGNKSKLERGNEVMKQSFEPIHQNFRDDPINDIAKANGPELIHKRSPQFLRNKSNKSVVLLF